MTEKPILFNTEMVRAILEGRKTQTRRIMKRQPPEGEKVEYNEYYNMLLIHNIPARHGPFEVGDVLWVRETWKSATGDPAGGGYALFDTYVYKADGNAKEDYPVDELMVEDRWHPSIHMPRKAARLFLRVTSVRAERLQNMSDKDAQEEGIGRLFLDAIAFGDKDYGCMEYIDYKGWLGMEKEQFAHLWDSTIKKSDLPLYGWGANPWVWVIEFERIDRGTTK